MISKEIEDKLLVNWHKTYGHRRNEFSEEQKAKRRELQRRGLLEFDVEDTEAVRATWR